MGSTDVSGKVVWGSPCWSSWTFRTPGLMGIALIYPAETREHMSHQTGKLENHLLKHIGRVGTCSFPGGYGFQSFFFVCKIAWGLYRKGCKRYKQRENAFVSSKASDMDKLLAVAAKTTFRIRPWHCSYGMANQPTPPRRTPTNKTLWKALLTIGFP